MRALITLALLAGSAHAAESRGTRLATIEPDQASYATGSRAILFIRPKRPTTSGMEFHLAIEGRPEKTKVIPLTSDLAAAISDRFTTPGLQRWSLSVYQQDRKEQLSLAKAIAGYGAEIKDITDLLARATEPGERAALEERLRVANQRKAILEEKAAGGRILVDRIPAEAPVTTANPAAPSAIPELFSLRAGRDPASWAVGETADFFAQPLVSFRGPDGVRENVLRGKFLGLTIYGTPVLTETRFVLPAFTGAHLGSQLFETEFLIRSKRQADRLRAAITQAMTQRDSYASERDASPDPADRAWLDLRIAEMQFVADALFQQLEEILVPVDTGDASFTVTP